MRDFKICSFQPLNSMTWARQTMWASPRTQPHPGWITQCNLTIQDPTILNNQTLCF